MTATDPAVTSPGRVALWQEYGDLPFEPLLVNSAAAADARRVFSERGFVTLGPPALDPELHGALVRESRRQRAVSAWDLVGDDDPGVMAQDTVRAQLGPVARELLASSAMRGLLATVTGRLVIPGWSATCLTFYDREGQFLGKHRDKVDACHFAVLYYLEASWPGLQPGPGVQLHVERFEDDPEPYRITARRNRMTIIHGSRLTHYRPRLGQAEVVTLIAGCYAVVE